MTKTNDGDRNVVCESNNSKMEISKLCLLFQLVENFYQCADMVIGMLNIFTQCTWNYTAATARIKSTTVRITTITKTRLITTTSVTTT